MMTLRKRRTPYGSFKALRVKTLGINQLQSVVKATRLRDKFSDKVVASDGCGTLRKRTIHVTHTYICCYTRCPIQHVCMGNMLRATGMGNMYVWTTYNYG